MADTTTMSPQHCCAAIANFLEADRGAWIRGTFAIDHRGARRQPSDPDARAWCALGLVQKFTRSVREYNGVVELLARALTPLGSGVIRAVDRYNDRVAKDVDDIIRLFRCASYMPDLEQRERFYTSDCLAEVYGFAPAANETITADETVIEKVEIAKGVYLHKVVGPKPLASGHNDVTPLKAPSAPNWWKLADVPNVMKTFARVFDTA